MFVIDKGRRKYDYEFFLKIVTLSCIYHYHLSHKINCELTGELGILFFMTVSTSIMKEPQSDDTFTHHVIDASDVLEALLDIEVFYSTKPYLRPNSSLILGENVDQDSREILCCWCFQMVDFFRFSRETVYIAFSCLDRFLSSTQGQIYLKNKEKFQLATVTCLYSAIKVHEAMELDVDLLVGLGKGLYSAAEILSTELEIAISLDWRLNPATPHAFVRNIIAMMPRCVSEENKSTILSLAMTQLDLATMNFALSINSKPSTVATSIVLNALHLAKTISRPDKNKAKKAIEAIANTKKERQAITACIQNLQILLGGGKVICTSSEVYEENTNNLTDYRPKKKVKALHKTDLRAPCA